MIVTGVIAPIRVNGVTHTAWPHSAIATSPSVIASSNRRGELTEMMVSTPGLAIISSRLMPRAIAIMAMPSKARSAPIAVQWNTLSLLTMLAR